MRREAHEKKYPDAKVISLGIGDTTQPIPSIVTSAMAEVYILLIHPSIYYFQHHQHVVEAKFLLPLNMRAYMNAKPHDRFIAEMALHQI